MEIKGDDLYGSDGQKLEMGGTLEKYEELVDMACKENALLGGIYVTGLMAEVGHLLKSMPSNEFRTKFLALITETNELVIDDMKKEKEKHN